MRATSSASPRRRATWPIACALAAGLAGAAFQARGMSVQDALTKAQALQKKGMILAALSPDYPAVKRNVLDAGRLWRAQVGTATPPVCAPPSVSFTVNDAIGFLRRVPEGRRATADAQTAVVDGLNERYRCR